MKTLKEFMNESFKNDALGHLLGKELATIKKGDKVKINSKDKDAKRFNGKVGTVTSIDGIYYTLKIPNFRSPGIEFRRSELTLASKAK